MVGKQGVKKLTDKDKENIKARIKHCEIFRKSEEETLLDLEDHKYNISRATLYNLKTELRDDMKKRFKDIGEHELAYEHDLALKAIKQLEPIVWTILNDPDTKVADKLRAMDELRGIKRDMIDFYGSHEIVKNVTEYFNKIREQERDKAIKEIGVKNE